MRFHETSPSRTSRTVECFSDIHPIVGQIRVACRETWVIGIDGFCGAGKTFVARQLSAALNADLISTDCHVVRQGGHLCYADRLDMVALGDLLHQAAREHRQVILEGICLLEVIERLGISRNSVCYVYVKRLSRNSGIWHDGDDLEEFDESDSTPTSIPEPHLSVLRYHKIFNPHQSADLEYRRIDHS